MDRNVLLILSVLGLHALALWQINLNPAPLLNTAPRWVTVLAPAPSVPVVEKAPPAKAALPPRAPTRARPTPAPTEPTHPAAAVMDLPARADFTGSSVAQTSSLNAPASTLTSAPPARGPVSAVTRAAPTPPSVQLPSKDADYLHNPPPSYPSISKRLGEQGKVLLDVLISKEGLALQSKVLQSSGFERLDQAARQAAMNWRYVPGRRDGIAEDMWFNVPIIFSLN